MSYAEYLRSPEWAARRRAALERAGRRCQVCAYRGRGLEVHHNSYERIGDERPEDVVVLCRLCHRRHHLRAPPPSRQAHKEVDLEPLKRAARALRSRTDAA